MFDGKPGVEEFAAVGKAVRRDIEHAHDERALAEREGAGRELELEFFALSHGESSLARRVRKKTTQRRPDRIGVDAARGGFAEKKLVEVEIADGLACGSVLGLFHGLLEFLGEDVFLVRFLEEGIRELVLALPFLLLEDARSLRQVHVRPRSYVGFV